MSTGELPTIDHRLRSCIEYGTEMYKPSPLVRSGVFSVVLMISFLGARSRPSSDVLEAKEKIMSGLNETLRALYIDLKDNAGTISRMPPNLLIINNSALDSLNIAFHNARYVLQVRGNIEGISQSLTLDELGLRNIIYPVSLRIVDLILNKRKLRARKIQHSLFDGLAKEDPSFYNETPLSNKGLVC